MNKSNHQMSLRLRRVLFFAIVTAFLTMQWSTAHIHLAEHHDHDGSHHQHDVTAHAHQLVNLHDDSIDSSHLNDNDSAGVVELGSDCNTQKSKQSDDPSIASITSYSPLNFRLVTKVILSKEFNISRLRYPDYSTIHLRAPPRLS